MKRKELEQVRKGLARFIDKRKYPEEPWQALLETFPDCFQGTVETVIQDLKDPAIVAYQMFITPGSQASSDERSRRGEGIPKLSEYELERSLVFSDCLSQLASADSVVERFRTEYVGGQVLTPQESRQLLTSPLTAEWSRFVLDRNRVPVVGHIYQVKEDMSDDWGPYS